MFHLMLTASIDDADEWSRTWEKFTEWSKEIGERVDAVHVSSHLAGTIGEDEEFYNEHTMVKVREALQGVLRSYDLELRLADPLINEMLNAGILFRERGPRS